MAEDYILQMKDITKRFGPVTALSHVNLNVRRGEIHSICGENGAGKSTLMNVLSGVYPYGSYEGDIEYNGKTAEFKTIRDSEKEGIVIIHQELALSPFLSVAENIFLGNERRTKTGAIDWDETRVQAAKYMKMVGLDANPDTEVRDLGVGKQQLVEIAKAFAKNVKLLILDEPTAALNDDDSEHLLQLMREWRDKHGVTCIMISHKLNEIAEISDTVTTIRDGQVIGEDMKVDATHPMDENKLITDMVGRPMTHMYPVHTGHPGKVIFEVKDWTVHDPMNPARKIDDGITFNARAGEIVGIAGLMGAGRTEMAMSVFGKAYGTDISGHVFINGKEVHLNNVHEAIEAGLAYATEDRKGWGLNLLQTIRENASLASLEKISHHGVVDSNRELVNVEKYHKDFNIKLNSVDDGITTLSGGNQQKVLLAKWVLSEPQILILDEPTRGIDVGAKYEIYEIIDRLADAGKAVVVISSELEELMGISDRIYTISAGHLTAEIPRSKFSQKYIMSYMMQDGTVSKGAGK